MSNLLALVASPRPLGNCEQVAKQLGLELGDSWRLFLLRLPTLDIRPCRACYRCLAPGASCPINDDMEQVIQAVADADALALVCPAYFLAPHSSLKKVVDRCLSLYNHADRLWGKPAVGVAVAGIEGMEGHCLLGVENFLKVMMADIKATAVLYGALPGEVFLDETNRRAVADLARCLVGPARPRPEPSCPLCAGRTFRFLEDGRIRCQLCSHTGVLEATADGLRARIEQGPHGLFLGRKEALEHRQWLLGMKERFLARRKELKQVSAAYRGLGTWVGHSDKASE